ncbi:MAG: hypothetical protein BWY85_01885 [Firmicutes bacterium ADurb.Bin506]|nr:MAG: hypothetical protein BWY85_01885 [Firmicutes bacterium ADurb.Bin506]
MSFGEDGADVGVALGVLREQYEVETAFHRELDTVYRLYAMLGGGTGEFHGTADVIMICYGDGTHAQLGAACDQLGTAARAIEE